MHNGNTTNSKNINLMNELRKLWEQHIMWTRSFIISTVSDLPDLHLVTTRLLQNPEDFSNLLKRFYGWEKAEKFEKLFTDHLLIAAKLVNDANTENTKGVEIARKQWYKNANDIAKFLASINPYWNEQQWKTMLHEHLEMTQDEAVYRLTEQYQPSIDVYDSIESQALKMADYMTNGIRKQFLT